MGRLGVLACQAASLAAVVLAWHVAVRTGVADPLFVPAPAAVATALWSTAREALPRLGDTLLKTLAGYALAVGLGVAGGLVPSPSALLVLLATIALGRTLFGIVLVLAYGVGMAMALSLAGLLLVRLQGRVAALLQRRRVRGLGRVLARLPALTALLVIVVGAGLVLRALSGTV